MTSSLCRLLQYAQPSSSEVEDLYSSYIANCIFNIFFSFTTIMLNSLTIHAMRKTSSLPKPLKTLLLSLAVSDLGVGLVLQPLFIAFMVKWLQHDKPSCAMYTAFTMIIIIFTAASFLCVTAITVDRFLAVHLHLRYQELVTRKRVVSVVILIWVFSLLFSLLAFWSRSNVTLVMLAVSQFSCLIASAFCYYKIYVAVRRHSNQIQALEVQQVAQNGKTISVASLRKSASGAFYVYLVFLVCYLPQNCSFVAVIFYGPVTAMKGVVVFTWTLTFVNSSLNPIVYCWKMRHIRHAVIVVLRKIFSPRRESVENFSYVNTASYAN